VAGGAVEGAGLVGAGVGGAGEAPKPSGVRTLMTGVENSKLSSAT
jgi:hypothetical protein